LAEAADVKTGMTSDGHPWIGAENPALEIVEFADYLCFQCKKMHHHLRKLVAQYPDAIRLIHRNYPMDHQFNPIVAEPFHEGAGKMAILAIHAAAIGKFWAMNDTLFNLPGADRRIDLNETARQAGMDSRTLAAALEHGPYLQRLLFEIRDGMKLGIVGTPSYLVNGKIYEGGLPPEVLAPVLGQRKK
jgi:protein-disulfide isomerase